MGKHQELLEKLREGRHTLAYQQALSSIYKTYKASIVRRLKNGQFQLSDDQAEEQYLEALTVFEHKVLDGANVSNIEAFLWGISRNKARELIRGEARRKERERLIGEEQALIDVPDDTLRAETCRRIYHEEISPVLGKSCSNILLLKAKGYKALEIAQELGYGGQNQSAVVRVRIYKCQKRLSKILDTHPQLKKTLSELFE